MNRLPTSPIDRWMVVKSMIAAAARSAESLPPAERVDVFEGIACAASQFRILGPESEPAEVAKSAANLAASLRDAESLQMHFIDMMTA